MNKRQRKKASKRSAARLKLSLQIMKALRFDYSGCTSGRLTWGQAIQTLPRDEHFMVDYGALEQRVLIETEHPGKDGIGPDVTVRRSKRS